MQTRPPLFFIALALASMPAVVRATPEAPLPASASATPAALVRLPKLPRGVTVATAASPACIDRSDGEPDPSVTTVDGRAIRFVWDHTPTGETRLRAKEGSATLWTRAFSFAGGPNASVCARSGWHVALAGQSRAGYHAVDVLTGHTVARADGLVTSPDGTFALVAPPQQWGTGCYQASRVLRLPLDRSGASKAIATPPVPWKTLCTTPFEQRDELARVVTALAIAPASDLYAFASTRELVVYDAKTDAQLATASLPAVPREANVEIAFATTGKQIIVRFSETTGDGGTAERALVFELRR
jgi:hypothetical protein